GRALARLNAVAAGLPRSTASARYSSLLSPVAAALDATPLARGWAADARAHLEILLASRTLGRSTRSLATVNTHFHLDRDATRSREAISRLSYVFGRIEGVLDAAAEVFREGGPMVESPVVEAPLGALHESDPVLRTITFRPGFAECGRNTRAALILHACAHFVGDADEIAHFALELPAPAAPAPARGHRTCGELPRAEALCNAPSCGASAIHGPPGSDQRSGARDPRL